MIRNFMRVTFPKVLDVLFILSIIGVMITSFSAGSNMFQSPFFSFTAFIAVLFPGVVGAIVAFGVIYVLLDIRDALQGKTQE